jgi:hypothetical protein
MVATSTYLHKQGCATSLAPSVTMTLLPHPFAHSVITNSHLLGLSIQNCLSWKLQNGDITWFPEGGFNITYNCIDRWAHQNLHKVFTSSNHFIELALKPTTIDIAALPCAVHETLLLTIPGMLMAAEALGKC